MPLLLLGAVAFFGAVCFVALRSLTLWPLWLELSVSALAGVFGLLGMFFMPSLFGDEATSLEWSSPVLGGSRRKKPQQEAHDGKANH